MGLDSDEIERGNIEDNTMYEVVHASSKWLSLDTLEKEFVPSFVLCDVGNCLYIIDVKWPAFDNENLHKRFWSSIVLQSA